MERMKPQRCCSPAGCFSHPAPSAKPTFDFYFGSRQHSTWEGVEKPHSSRPATSGAGTVRGRALGTRERARGPPP
jgi:hypothetical protein